MDGDLREFTIVGVVGDVRDVSLASTPRPTVYALFRQRPNAASSQYVVMATQGDPAPVMAAARQIVRDLRPDAPPRMRTMESIVSRSVADRSFVLLLVGVFAGVALFVAALGVYSVISYLVTQRKREISIRVALGARAADIVRLVLGQGATLSLIGVAVGAVASLGAARVLAKSLYEISPTDPVAFGSVIVVLVAVALVASWLPARRAARVEAMDVLRGG
jgi:ABC-type antimicrobial peptide transport system permease subunit